MGLSSRKALKKQEIKQEAKASTPEEIQETRPMPEINISPETAPEIKTILDSIYEDVLSKKSVTLEQLSNKFRIKRAIIEQWARILDKQGLAVLYYPIVGEPELRIKKENKKEEKKTK